MSIVYVTVTTLNYLPRALCLYRSFERLGVEGSFVFFCIDTESAEALKALGINNCLVKSDYATAEIEEAKGRMRFSEYCMLFKPICIEAVFKEFNDTQSCIYLDGDMLFFKDPKNIFAEYLDADALLTHHRYSPNMEKWAPRVGFHNGGFAAFRNTGEAYKILKNWLESCLERPHYKDRLGDTFDQKIFDAMPEKFNNVVTLPAKGINTGPWDIDNYQVETINGSIYVDNEPLFLFHYQGMRFHRFNISDIYNGDRKERPEVVNIIYHPYLKHLKNVDQEILRVLPSFKWRTQPLFSNYSLLRWHAQRIRTGRSNLVFSNYR